jgi:predicted RNA-binding protein with PUA-like domain
MTNAAWLVKQEPDDYSWQTFVAEGATAWVGVRNFQARNYLRAMKRDDLVFFYHSGREKTVVGLARVIREAYPDPTAQAGDWVAVDLAAGQPLRKPLPLSALKTDAVLRDLPLVRQSRLSVSPVTPLQCQRLFALSETKRPK